MASPTAAMDSLEKRRLKDRKRNFNPQWEQDFAFINYEGKPLCLICNISLTHFKSCNLKRHYETHHKQFAADYPPWSDSRRAKLHALKIDRTHTEVPLPPSSDQDGELCLRAGRTLARTMQQLGTPWAESDVCKQLLSRLVTTLDPNNVRLHRLIHMLPIKATDDQSIRPEASSSNYRHSSSQSLPNNSPADGTGLVRLLTNNVRLIESSLGCFICTLCPVRTTQLNNVYSSTEPVAFESHLRSEHSQDKTMICVFCGWQVMCNQIVEHVTEHLAGAFAVNQPSDLYPCPFESSCPLDYHTNVFSNLEAHWIAQHRSSSDQTVYKCPNCSQRFTTLLTWGKHMKRSYRPLLHCTAPGCLVKSPSTKLMEDHIKLKHTNHMPSCDDENMVLFKQSNEVICNKTELVPTTNSDVRDLDLSLMKAEVDLHQSNRVQRDGFDLEPKFVFYLRCPHCSLTTIRWHYFVLHASKCPGLLTAANRHDSQSISSSLSHTFRCRIYWCSECQAVSTEKSLVTEHVTYSHDSRAILIHEKLQVKLLDVNTPALLSEADTSSVIFPNTTTPARSNISVNSIKPTASFYVNPVRPTSPDNDDEPESAMNLAALARPSQFTSPLASSSSTIIPSLPVDTSWISNSETGLPQPPITLFNNTDALKSLQGLASASGISSDTSTMTASVMSAMAAALTSLTGFDVSQTLTATDPTTVSLPLSTSSTANNNTPLVIPSNSGADDVLNSSDDMANTTTPRTSDDLVCFPFEESKFRREFSATLRPDIMNNLVEKMHKFATYHVRILGKENHRRIPVCPECDKVFPYGLGDFKRHLLTVHLEIPREYLKECLRFTFLPKCEPKFQEAQDQLAMRQMKPHALDRSRQQVPLPYSIPVLRRLTRHLPSVTQEFIEQKMQLYSRLSAIVENKNGMRRYNCSRCNYSSPHALADVRKHILGSHCSISTKHFRHCLQASRLDPVEFTLFSDDKLTRLAKEYMHRHHGSEAFLSAGSSSPNADDEEVEEDVDAGTKNGYTEIESVESNASNSETEDRSTNAYVSHFTTLVPGSKTPVTVRIRPPIPPEQNGSSDNATSSRTAPKPATPHSGTSPDSSNEVSASHNLDEADLRGLSSIPGVEEVDNIVEIALPFSASVLEQLLKASGATSQQSADMFNKMKIYSTYKISRICKGDRTVAFRCPCGRLFLTTRHPERQIRAATLADIRRHIMGVHARIPNDFLTICCQASRITRENDFQLYPEEILLRLALDRNIKVINPQNTVNGAGTKAIAPNVKFGKAERLSEDCTVDESNLTEDGSGVDRDVYEDDYPLTIDEAADLKKPCTPMADPLIHLQQAQASETEDVERIIDLPYSSNALHNLVEGYCPRSYFPILEDKMNVYNSLKVFITRRRGRRYFCCSGCASASPHGMGDIRKHILGVHAKVPERYKAAAMHCSRLSREDNTLLPDHVLLHLAKMKWKGTVIKPLAEMDLSQFGVRRASAVGLVRPSSGQFASQVYQPSVQHRDSEKLTALSASVTSGTALSPSHSLHDDADSSFDFSHHRRSNEDEQSPFDGPKEPYIIQLADKQDPISGDLSYACSNCPFVCKDCDEMRSHVADEHLQLPVAACPYCTETFRTHDEAMQHHRSIHSGLEVISSQYQSVYQEAKSKILVRQIEKDIRSADETDYFNTSSCVSRHSDVDISIDDYSTPAKMARLEPDLTSFSPNGVTNDNLSLSDPTHQLISSQPKLDQRVGLSGSSRRKPSKMQLVQLKPEAVPPT